MCALSRILTTDELAEFFSVTTQTIKTWRKEGMPHIKIKHNVIRYDVDDVMKWAKETSKE